RARGRRPGPHSRRAPRRARRRAHARDMRAALPLSGHGTGRAGALALRRLAQAGLLLDAGDLDQLRDRLGRLRALAEPVLDLRLVEVDRRRVGLRVVPAHDLEELAVARRAR